MEVLLFFHQAPHIEKESGAEGKENVGDSQATLDSQLHTTSYGLSNLFISITMFMNTTFLYCIYAILNLSNSYILTSLKYLSSANYDVLASYTTSYLSNSPPGESSTRKV